jgi:segregation and condensation protein A
MTDYKVSLDIYNGPLDLLLYLIKRSEIDIYDIPIAKVAKQYVEYIGMIEQLDPDYAAEFLVLAATLMEIKSRMLLPRPPAEEQEQEAFDDPRLELVRQLLEYKTYKDAAFELGDRGIDRSMRFERFPALRPDEPIEYELEDMQIWDLFAAFNQIMSQVGRTPVTHDVVYDDTPLSLHATDIQDRLIREGGKLTFAAIFEGRNKSEMIGLFLALLELVRQKRVSAAQDIGFGAIAIVLLDATPVTELTEEEPEADASDTDAEEEYPLEADENDLANDDIDAEPLDEEMAQFDAQLNSIETDAPLPDAGSNDENAPVAPKSPRT